jgi:tetratricopeptide (TPR) repeat protein
MARSFLSFTFALATATLILFGAEAMPASAQPATPAASAAAPRARQYPEVQEAVQLFGRRQISEAIKALENLSRKNPELPSARVMAYEILMQMKEPNAARFQLELAIHITPSDPEPYIILGNIALQDRRIAEATMDFERAKQLLATYPNVSRKATMEPLTLSGIAQVAEAREDWKEAESRLREFLRLAPQDLMGHQRLARSLFWQGKAGDAYDTLKKAKQIDRDSAARNHTKELVMTPEAIMARFYDEFEGPKSTNPEIWFKAALKTAPDDLATRQEVARWALDKGKLAFAKEQAEAASKIEVANSKYSGSNVGHMLRGVVALWEKDWPEAEQDFQKIILENPNDSGAKNDIALALVEQEDPAKKQRALAYAEANYRDNKNNPDALSTLAWVYFRRNEFEQAGAAIEQAVKASNGNLSNDMATYLAHILYHRDKKWEAKELLDSILKDGRPFSMRPEALKLYEKVKDAARPAEASAPAVPMVTPKP